MYKRICIVASAEGFIIKGLETKLDGIGILPVYSQPNVKDLKAACDNTDIVIIFTDDNTVKVTNALVYIKDHCSEKYEQIMIIGAKAEYEMIKSYIPESLVYKFYERPLDMESLISDVEEYMEEGSQIARRKSILIVDDDVAYMSIIMEWLKDTYRVSLANSGMEAITWLANNHADLILLDYEMPITDGPQVFQMIRSSASTSDIPVMFLTGKGDKESIMKVLALKPAGYILKTVEKRELRETISRYFAAH